MATGRHGLSAKQIFKLAEFQGFKCPLSGIDFTFKGSDVYD